MDVHIADDAVWINDKNGALGISLAPQDTKLLGNPPMRPEIA